VLDAHYFAVLVGVGATAVNAYLAQEIFQDRMDRGVYGKISLHDACVNYKNSIEAGLMKIIAKKGIAVISSYRGGYEFEAMGLSRALSASSFPASSRISGIGLAGLSPSCWNCTVRVEAWTGRPPPPHRRLLQDPRRSGESHAHDAKTIHLLQDACNRGDYKRFKPIPRPCAPSPTTPRATCWTGATAWPCRL
jgi:glutamate synthase (NADPH/NADH) large chain